MPLYALIANGTIMESTVAHTRDACWDLAFTFLADNGCGNLLRRHALNIQYERNSGIPASKSRYFHRRFGVDCVAFNAGKRYAKRWGYEIREVAVTLVA